MIERNLSEKYRPQTLADIVGQSWGVEQLQEYVQAPVPTAFLFEGATGTGKTSAALALAADLGVDLAAGPPGGLHQIASGEQTGQSVRDKMSGLRFYTSSGSGWKVLIVNEDVRDAMWQVSVMGVNGPIKFEKDGPAGKESGQSKPSIFIVQIKDGKIALPSVAAKK